MPRETQLHRTLKKEACRWLFNQGYCAVAAEVNLKPMGIVDAAGCGTFRPYHNFHGTRYETHQTCIIECKASRADFLRDLTNEGQMTLCLMERHYNQRKNSRGRRGVRQALGLGKFSACLAQPFANLHYLLVPAGLIQKKEVPPRWGLLSYGQGGITVVVKPTWQEISAGMFVESAIAKRLTGDIFRADERAIISINREIMKQQQDLAEKIRQLRPMVPMLPVLEKAAESLDELGTDVQAAIASPLGEQLPIDSGNG